MAIKISVAKKMEVGNLNHSQHVFKKVRNEIFNSKKFFSIRFTNFSGHKFKKCNWGSDGP